jgi:hypothetical protein
VKWGSRYPRTGVHECMYGQEQAELVTALAIANGVEAEVVVDRGDGIWKGKYE